MKNIAGFALISIILTSCGSGENEGSSGSDTFASEVVAMHGCAQGNNEIVGCWVTQQCDEAIYNGESLGRWDNFVYYFKSDGTIRTVDLKYDNAACSGEPIISLNTEFFDRMTYSQFSEIITDDGFNGFEIMLSYDSQFAPVLVVYHISDMNELCFSSNILLGANYSSFDNLGNPLNIDFDNCLLPVN